MDFLFQKRKLVNVKDLNNLNNILHTLETYNKLWTMSWNYKKMGKNS